jgi:hypothetical protein
MRRLGTKGGRVWGMIGFMAATSALATRHSRLLLPLPQQQPLLQEVGAVQLPHQLLRSFMLLPWTTRSVLRWIEFNFSNKFIYLKIKSIINIWKLQMEINILIF